MKRIGTIAIILAAIVFSALPAKAQVSFTIPFDFSVGDTSLPSGTYKVAKTGAASSLLTLHHTQEKWSAVFPINSVQSQFEAASDNTKLVFHRYGNKYFLTQFWTQGSFIGSQLRRSKSERRIADNAVKEILTASK